MGPRPFFVLCYNYNMNSFREMYVLLHNIRSAHNVGSIFRTADAIGITKIFLSGYTPAPLDRFKRPVKEIAKTALGAEQAIPWEQYENPFSLILTLKEQGFTVVAVEQDEKSIDYKAFQPTQKTLIVMGEEVGGISEELRNACDAFVEIPMHGTKESLNVSVAFGVATYGMFDR